MEGTETIEESKKLSSTNHGPTLIKEAIAFTKKERCFEKAIFSE